MLYFDQKPQYTPAEFRRLMRRFPEIPNLLQLRNEMGADSTDFIRVGLTRATPNLPFFVITDGILEGHNSFPVSAGWGPDRVGQTSVQVFLVAADGKILMGRNLRMQPTPFRLRELASSRCIEEAARIVISETTHWYGEGTKGQQLEGRKYPNYLRTELIFHELTLPKGVASWGDYFRSVKLLENVSIDSNVLDSRYPLAEEEVEAVKAIQQELGASLRSAVLPIGYSGPRPTRACPFDATLARMSLVRTAHETAQSVEVSSASGKTSIQFSMLDKTGEMTAAKFNGTVPDARKLLTKFLREWDKLSEAEKSVFWKPRN